MLDECYNRGAPCYFLSLTLEELPTAAGKKKIGGKYNRYLLMNLTTHTSTLKTIATQ